MHEHVTEPQHYFDYSRINRERSMRESAAAAMLAKLINDARSEEFGLPDERHIILGDS